MQVRGRQLDLDALLVVMLGVKMLEQGDRILGRKLKAAEMLGQQGAHISGNPLEKLLVRLIDEMVLVAQREAVGDPHADVLVGADDRLGALFDLRQLARHPAVNMLHCRDPRGDHLERRIEGVEVDIEVAGDEARGEPELERHIGRAQLDRREADVMMTVDEAGQQHLLACADDRRIWIGAAQLSESADRDDTPVALQHGAVVDLLPSMTIERPRDDMLSANDR